MSEPDLDTLAAEFEELAPQRKEAARTPREERILAGFEEIQRFVEKHGHVPRHGGDRDIFERLYAVRLDRLRALDECRELLAPIDHQGILSGAADSAPGEEDIDLDELATELGREVDPAGLTELRHVRSTAQKRAAEKIANRAPCPDFARFKPLFDQVLAEMRDGRRKAEPITADNRAIEVGDFFVLDGLTLHVAEKGEALKVTAGEIDRRLRVIYSNGTESNILLRSLQRAFYEDPAARRLAVTGKGQMSFGNEMEADDIGSGTIYVLRSLSDHPFIAEHRELVHKIGVTGGKVETRIANAEFDPTYLLAKVEVAATYRLAGINRTRMEHLFHRLFAPGRLNIEIKDRFGRPVQPREWFLVPLFVIEEAIERIRDGSITRYSYDPASASLKETSDAGS